MQPHTERTVQTLQQLFSTS